VPVVVCWCLQCLQ